MQTIEAVKDLVAKTLQLGERGAHLALASPLLGALPELDSMAVMSVVAALESRFDIVVDDDDNNARTFATLVSLCAYVDGKMPA